ncbi:MAG: hypothetical protein FWF94_05545 [Oscillospiraceae bacterium]|nr:hypothetical protein [Oscillospiraceae bacterium]
MKKLLSLLLTAAMLCAVAIPATLATATTPVEEYDTSRISPDLMEIMNNSSDDELIPVVFFTWRGIEHYEEAQTKEAFCEFMGVEKDFIRLPLGLNMTFSEEPWIWVTFEATVTEIMELMALDTLRVGIITVFEGHDKWEESIFKTHINKCKCDVSRVLCNCYICIELRGYESVPEYTIFDVVDILEYIIGSTFTINDCPVTKSIYLLTEESKATGEPTIFDAIYILEKLVGM